MTDFYSLSVPSLSLAFLQADPGQGSRDEHWMMIAVVVIAISMAAMAIVALVAGMKALKMVGEFKELAVDLHGKATPIMQKTSAIIDDLSPKIRTVSENVTQVSYTVREKVDEVGQTVTEVNRTVVEANQKARGQVQHVDRMVADVLTTTEDIAHSVSHGIRVPAKQIAGIITGLRVGIETLVKNFTPRNGSGPGGRSGSAL